MADDMAPGTSNETVEGDQTERTAKRRRVQKPLERFYECNQPGCDKSYSRQEHLSRHQLNHKPKHIYHCDYPGCDRYFVRQDLCTRHKERHAARDAVAARQANAKSDFDNSQNMSNGHSATNNDRVKADSLRRDSTMTSIPDRLSRLPNGHQYHQAHQPSYVRPQSHAHTDHDDVGRYTRPVHDQDNNGLAPSPNHHFVNGPPIDHKDPTLATVQGRGFHANSDLTPSDHSAFKGQSASSQVSSTYSQLRYASMDANNMSSSSMVTYPPLFSDQQMQQRASDPVEATSANQGVAIQNGAVGMSMYPAQDPVSSNTTPIVVEDRSMLSPASQPLSELAYLPNYNHEVSYAQAFSLPIFNHETALNTPFGTTDDFATWLLDPEINLLSGPALAPDVAIPMLSIPPPEVAHQLTPSYTDDSPAVTQPCPMPLSPRPLDSRILLTRRQKLVDYIVDEFRDSRRVSISRSRNELLTGDHEVYPHMLSLRMLQACLSSFWIHVDQQYPILHRPTFDPDTAPDLLILTLIAIGASCLDATYSHGVRKTASEWAYFLAWHIRNKLYQDYDFGPPAKLWIFQTLLLLELFEKLYSTRELHERAHVHHATTIALMRRGSSLVGIADQPARMNPWHATRDFTGSINMCGINTDDTEFNKWISAEAIKRVALLAFILDTMHATMFGHTAAMMPHEVRIRLPCDEYTWAASSYAEVQQRMQETKQLQARDNDMTFDEALKRILNGRSFRTGRFGRVSIMAGLLSLSWHLKLHDMRISSVGVGKKGGWAPKIFQAIDFWKTDLRMAPVIAMRTPASHASDRSDSHDADNAGSKSLQVAGPDRAKNAEQELWSDWDNVIESPMVLHHLAHMTMHCEVVDFQIYAGATVALGRHITTDDRQTATRKIRDLWAPSASGQDAVYHALKFLSETLLRSEDCQRFVQHVGDASAANDLELETAYHPRHDVMLSRPWVLYISVLVVWSYGYALDGSIAQPAHVPSTQQARVFDLYGYLMRVGGVASPDELGHTRDRNRCVGLLMVVRDMLRATRWELLYDAAASLKDCILLLIPDIEID